MNLTPLALIVVALILIYFGFTGKLHVILASIFTPERVEVIK